MKRILKASVFALTLAGCTTAQLDRARDYQGKLAGACQIAMLLPVGPVAPWLMAGCASEAAIAKLALDPTSLEWLRGLVAKTTMPS